MADNRTYDDHGDVIGGYLTPQEARDAGVEWHGRPNEPTPYATPDEARGLGIPWRPESDFPAYNYNNAYAASATPASRARGANPLEQLMAHVAKMEATPGGWKSGAFALSAPQKQAMFPDLPGHWGSVHDYSNIPMNTPDEIAAGRGTGSGGTDPFAPPPRPPGVPANWEWKWSPFAKAYQWVPPGTWF